MTDKRDFLGECNDQGVPLEDFRLAFCVRCFQKDCSRSQFGTSKFEARVGSWEDRLFHAPQLPKTDPRYSTIAAKRFLTLSAGPTPSVREWIDPRVDTPPILAQSPVPSAPTPSSVVQQEVVETPPSAQVEAPKQPETPNLLVEMPTTEAPPERRQRPLNTPYQGPVTIGSAKPEPPKDAWAAPAPLKSGEKVVQPGARVKIGGSDR